MKISKEMLLNMYGQYKFELGREGKGEHVKTQRFPFNFLTRLLQRLPCHPESVYWVLKVLSPCHRVKCSVLTLPLHRTQSSHTSPWNFLVPDQSESGSVPVFLQSCN